MNTTSSISNSVFPHAASYEREFTSLRLVQSPRRIARLARVLLIGLVVTTCAMAFLPWRQTSAGTGRIVAYHPTERPQTIESPIDGRIVRWGGAFVEGTRVKKDQVILEIRDNDPGLASRLSVQVLAYQEKLAQSQNKSDTYGRQVVDLTEAREQVMEGGRQWIEEARRKLEAEKHAAEGAEAAVSQTRANLERQKTLFEKGLTSGVSFERDQRSYDEAVAKRKAATQYIEAAQNYLKAKEAELQQKARESQTKIDYALALQQEALGDVAHAKKELSEMEGKRAEFESRVVVAPRDGIILRLMANANAEMLKEGDPLFTIVPDSADRAVELWIDGNDVPLVTMNREVRLQFEGWPAIQFASGWPEIALGTYGGRVMAVDATDNGKGKFRVLVSPDDVHPWPDEHLLRQGVRANGWIMLNDVKLGYELWRQMNGFPAVYGDTATGPGDAKGTEDADKESKKIKLPK